MEFCGHYTCPPFRNLKKLRTSTKPKPGEKQNHVGHASANGTEKENQKNIGDNAEDKSETTRIQQQAAYTQS